MGLKGHDADVEPASRVGKPELRSIFGVVERVWLDDQILVVRRQRRPSRLIETAVYDDVDLFCFELSGHDARQTRVGCKRVSVDGAAEKQQRTHKRHRIMPALGGGTMVDQCVTTPIRRRDVADVQPRGSPEVQCLFERRHKTTRVSPQSYQEWETGGPARRDA